MAGPTCNPYASNRHADVLNEEPQEEAAKLRLAEEVKNRAKGAFQQKDMQSAELLYGKAISLLDSIPGKSEAALYSNRSMVRLNLHKVEDALNDAEKCLGVDPGFVKAYHRKAQALLRMSEWAAAIAAAEGGLKLEPDNKAFHELIEKAKVDQEKDIADKARLKRDAQDVRVELHNASTARVPAQKKERKEGEGEDADLSMKGYKTRADGKKTSYFHTDISDEAKRLIEAQGFGKPQKLEQAPEVQDTAKGGGSQWNQAGTYEEKGMVKWFESRVRSGFANASFAIPTGGEIKIVTIDRLKGDANISVSRGKRRHLLDYAFDVSFETNVDQHVGKGKLLITEISSSLDDDPEIAVEVSPDTHQELRGVVDAYVKTDSQGLQALVRERLRDIVNDYLAQ